MIQTTQTLLKTNSQNLNIKKGNLPIEALSSCCVGHRSSRQCTLQRQSMVSYPRRSTKPHTIDEIAGGLVVPIDEVSSLAVPIDKIPMLSYVRGCLQPASFAVLSNTAAILIASEIDAFKRTSTRKHRTPYGNFETTTIWHSQTPFLN